jgi:hypothetical protein
LKQKKSENEEKGESGGRRPTLIPDAIPNYYATHGPQEGFFGLRLVSRRKIILKEKMADTKQGVRFQARLLADR